MKIDRINKRGVVMPIRMDELDGIQEKPKLVMDKMEEGIFYSLEEMAEKILGKKVPVFPKKGELESYLREQGIKIEKGKAKTGDLVIPIASIFCDMAYVFSILAVHGIRGEIIQGFKDDMPYYGKPIPK